MLVRTALQTVLELHHYPMSCMHKMGINKMRTNLCALMLTDKDCSYIRQILFVPVQTGLLLLVSFLFMYLFVHLLIVNEMAISHILS